MWHLCSHIIRTVPCLGHLRAEGMLTSSEDPAELHQDGFDGTMFMYRGAEGDGFAQHREQKAESISLLPSAPLGANFTGRTEPDSSQRCKAKERDRKVTACSQGNTKHCLCHPPLWVSGE